MIRRILILLALAALLPCGAPYQGLSEAEAEAYIDAYANVMRRLMDAITPWPTLPPGRPKIVWKPK